MPPLRGWGIQSRVGATKMPPLTGLLQRRPAQERRAGHGPRGLAVSNEPRTDDAASGPVIIIVPMIVPIPSLFQKRTVIRLVIVSVIILQMLWALLPRDMSRPRSQEAIEAIRVWQANPSAETKAALLEQIRRDVIRNRERGQTLLCLMFLADMVALYFVWNYRGPKAHS